MGVVPSQSAGPSRAFCLPSGAQRTVSADLATSVALYRITPNFALLGATSSPVSGLPKPLFHRVWRKKALASAELGPYPLQTAVWRPF